MQYFLLIKPQKWSSLKSFSAALVPLLLILAQPDSSTLDTGTLWSRHLADADRRATIAVAGFIGFAFLSSKDDYSQSPCCDYVNPWADYYGAGYQLAQGFYALALVELLWRWLWFFSPEIFVFAYGSHDFIFAVIGEELGFTFWVFAVFGAPKAGFKHCSLCTRFDRQASHAGCTSMFIIQAFC